MKEEKQKNNYPLYDVPYLVREPNGYKTLKAYYWHICGDEYDNQ